MGIIHRGLNGQFGMCMIPGRRTVINGSRYLADDKRAPWRNMEFVGHDQSHMAIDAAAFIPPAFQESRIDKHRESIRPVIMQKLADVISKAGITAGMLPHQLTVNKHHRIPIHPAEIQPDGLATRCGRHAERPPIPCRIHRQVAVQCVLIPITVPSATVGEFSRHNVIIGQLHRLPHTGGPRTVQLCDLRCIQYRGSFPAIEVRHFINNPMAIQQPNRTCVAGRHIAIGS